MTDLLARTLAAAEQRAREGARAELRARGVVATPSELARRGVIRVDELLRELGVEEGLASERVTILDPAVGTGVWLAAVLEHTRHDGARSRLLGFDTDPAALATVRDLLSAEATAQGATLTLSCANTLELAAPFPDPQAVRVILGNPPWAARSLSRGGALSDAWLAEFRLDHRGAPLGERRAGVLSDDYVRFFRWALEQARTAHAGAVLCLATNGSFADGPVHRGMRAALLRDFDRLELLDLGGNSLLSRRGEAVRDESLFGVRVGAALTWGLRHAGQGTRAGRVRFAELRGSLPDKLRALATPQVAIEHQPGAPWFRLRPEPTATVRPGFSIAEAFPFQREGVQTNRDAIATARDRDELLQRVRELADGKLAVAAQRHFDPRRARAVLRAALERGECCVAELAYRPLEARWFISLPPLCHRPRPELQRAVQQSSRCLLAVRKDRGDAAFNLFAAARVTADACFLSTRSSCRTRVFPSHTPDGACNLSPAIAEQLAERIGRRPSAAELILYALAVLGSPRHRAEQQRALQLDYAQLPWPRDAAHFAAALEVGARFEDALTRPGALQLGSVGLEPSERLQAVVYDPSARTVSSLGRTLFAEVDASCWGAQVGHHGLLASLLRRGDPTLATLEDALARARAWVQAEAAADALRGEPGE